MLHKQQVTQHEFVILLQAVPLDSTLRANIKFYTVKQLVELALQVAAWMGDSTIMEQSAFLLADVLSLKMQRGSSAHELITALLQLPQSHLQRVCEYALQCSCATSRAFHLAPCALQPAYVSLFVRHTRTDDADGAAVQQLRNVLCDHLQLQPCKVAGGSVAWDQSESSTFLQHTLSIPQLHSISFQRIMLTPQNTCTFAALLLRHASSLTELSLGKTSFLEDTHCALMLQDALAQLTQLRSLRLGNGREHMSRAGDRYGNSISQPQQDAGRSCAILLQHLSLTKLILHNRLLVPTSGAPQCELLQAMAWQTQLRQLSVPCSSLFAALCKLQMTPGQDGAARLLAHSATASAPALPVQLPVMSLRSIMIGRCGDAWHAHVTAELSNLTRLHLQPVIELRCSVLDAALPGVVSALPRLQDFAVGASSKAASEQALAAALASRSKLRTLQRGIEIDVPVLPAAAPDAPQMLPHVRELHLRIKGESALPSVLQGLVLISTLRHVRVRMCRFTDSFALLQNLMQACGQLAALTQLEMENMNAPTMASFELLANLPQLQVLKLVALQGRNTETHELALAKLASLRTLHCTAADVDVTQMVCHSLADLAAGSHPSKLELVTVEGEAVLDESCLSGILEWADKSAVQTLRLPSIGEQCKHKAERMLHAFNLRHAGCKVCTCTEHERGWRSASMLPDRGRMGRYHYSPTFADSSDESC